MNVNVYNDVTQNVAIRNLPNIDIHRVGHQQLPINRENFTGNNLNFYLNTKATNDYTIMHKNQYIVNLKGIPATATYQGIKMISKSLGLVRIVDKGTTTAYAVKCGNYNIENTSVDCSLGASMVFPADVPIGDAWPLKSTRAYREDQGYFWFEYKPDPTTFDIHIVHFSFEQMTDSVFVPATNMEVKQMHYTLTGKDSDLATFILTDTASNTVQFL